METIIRQESSDDYYKVNEIIKLAFGQDDESQLVDKIRKGENFVPELSMIAEVEGELVGHILFSKIKINGNQEYGSLALAPVAVLPEYQNKGIGGELIWQGLKRATELGFDSVIVLGHENFYPRFGFERASKWNIQCPFRVPDENFMAIELITDGLTGKSGDVSYPQEFLELE
jgi:predicted N-acetyltransferase YhbS